MERNRNHAHRDKEYEVEGTAVRKIKLAVYEEPEEYGEAAPERDQANRGGGTGHKRRAAAGLVRPKRKKKAKRSAGSRRAVGYGYAEEAAEPARRKRGTGYAAAPEKRRRRQPERYREPEQPPRLAPRSAAPAINFFSMLVLTAAIGLTFFTCFSYLQVQADIHTLKSRTAALVEKTSNLADKNNNTELAITNSIDLAEIQEIAMEELGMVYPYNNQMISFEAGKSGYVRQYGELAGNEQESLIELLFRMLFARRVPLPEEEGE